MHLGSIVRSDMTIVAVCALSAASLKNAFGWRS